MQADNFLMFIYLFWEREREEEVQIGRERIPTRLHTVSADSLTMVFNLKKCEIVTWAETKSQTLNWLSHPGPLKLIILIWQNNIQIKTKVWKNENESVHTE